MDTTRPAIVEAPWTRSADEVVRSLSSSPTGLTPEEALRRSREHGRNELAEASGVHPFSLLIAQFRSVLVVILVAAAALSGATGEWADCAAIGGILLANAVIGFYQEYSAERSLAALRKMTGRIAKVRRANVVSAIPAAEVTVGDIILLEAGDVVPADARLLETAGLSIVESALTGESVPVEKEAGAIHAHPSTALGDRSNMVWLGTAVAAGTSLAVVTAIGMHTEVGRIAGMVATAGEGDVTPLQRRFAELGRKLAAVALAAVAVVFAVGALRGMPLLDLLLASVSLAVAAVPEGLPAVVTIALAIGVRRMARRRALIRRLQAVETLGAATVVCSDKTGTLTLGDMTVRALIVGRRHFDVTGDGYAPQGEIRASDGGTADDTHRLLLTFAGSSTASLARDANGGWSVVGDPTEGALLSAAGKRGIDPKSIELRFPKCGEIPFDSERKRMSVLRRVAADGDAVRVFVKGAPDIVLSCCVAIRDGDTTRPLTDSDREAIRDDLARLAARAMRVLAAAEREFTSRPESLDPETIESRLTWLGVAAMVDPPRPEARGAVEKCHGAGIRVAMITGDHPATAQAIALEIGISKRSDRALSGPEIDRLDDAALSQALRADPPVTVFARVSAAHKLRIVRALRNNGEVVAMTGDGVNDSPAIKGADVGIAMGRGGAEVTKEASDIVITDDRFATIVEAIEQGRGASRNIRKALMYLLAGNLGELLYVTTCIASGLPMPLAPIQLLWINLITDGLPALCLAVDPIDDDVMRSKPRSPQAPIIGRTFIATITTSGVVTASTALAVFLYTLRSGDVAKAQAHGFTVLVFIELLRSFCFRSEKRPLWSIDLTTNRRLLLVVVIGVAVQFAVPHLQPLTDILHVNRMAVTDCAVLLAIAIVATFALEVIKVLRRRLATR
jgi:P-type Ca2+ transporter type 2C